MDILGYFLTENWLITTVGIVIGCAMGIGFNYWLVISFELPRLDWYYLAFGILSIWVLGLISVFAPARKASWVSPALATRNL
jgi:putative ABC transport system permease protein